MCIRDSFTNLKNNHGQNLQDIIDLNLDSDSQSALDSLSTFCPNCSTMETTDGDGNQNKPHSVTDALDALKTGANEEFTLIKDTCKLVHEGAVAGKEQVDNPSMDDAISSLESVVSLISGIIVTFDTSFGSIGNSYNTCLLYTSPSPRD